MLRIMVIRKKEDDERPVFGVGQVLCGLQENSEDRERASALPETRGAQPEAAPEPTREGDAGVPEASQSEEIARAQDASSLSGLVYAGVRSLKEYHLRLTREGWKPPPVEQQELKYAGKLSGRRKLRDEDVVRLRRNEEQLSYNHWAKIYKVAPAVIWAAMKGYTYKHLNWKYPPIR